MRDVQSLQLLELSEQISGRGHVVTVMLEFGNDLPLPSDVPLTLSNVLFGFLQVECQYVFRRGIRTPLAG